MLNNKVILITGGSGFLGRNLAKYILKNYTPQKIIIYSRNEAKQYEAQLELRDDPNIPNNGKLRWILGSITDYKTLLSAIDDSSIVIHAAACKRIQSGVYNPFEMINVNVQGTENVVRACIESYVEKLIYISSDKAVNPILLYGMTKALGEKIIQHAHVYQEKHNITMTGVRYGNVWGSTGSIVPFFQSVDKNDALPVTSPLMTRFTLTIDQSIQTVMDSMELCKAGQILVPKIKSYKVVDLVRAFERDYKIIGIRDQEKLNEQLLSEHDNYIEHDNYYIVNQFATNDTKSGLNYVSNNNEFLSVDELRRMISEKNN